MTESTRQTWPANAWLLQIDDVRVDTRYRRVVRPEQTVELPQRTFDLLMLFLREPHVLHPRADLFQRVWPGVIVEDANLSQAIWVLRKALGPERKDWIRTVAKGGYVFEPPAPITAVGDGAATGPAQADPSGIATGPLNAPLAAQAPPSLVPPPGTPLGAEEDYVKPSVEDPCLPPPPIRTPPFPPARRWWIAATMLCLAALAVSASWFGGQSDRRASASTDVLLIEVQPPDTQEGDANWRTTVLHAWLDWKLRALPDVNVLREENLAAGKSPARPNVMLLATGASPDRAGDIYVRASFDGLAGNESVQVVGPAHDLPRLVDTASNEVLRRLIPGRAKDVWPPLALDPASARRFADTFKALERRDWASARVAAQDVIQRSPRFGVARLQLAVALGRLGQAGLAIEQFATARAMLKPLPADAGKVIDALQLAADPRRLLDAAEASGELAKAYPNRRAFLLDQAKLLARAGQLDQARAILERPDWTTEALGLRIPQLLSLADMHLQLGDPQQARVHADQARKLAEAAGRGWQIEHAMALTIEAEANAVQYEGKADLGLFERAAREFEAAGDEIDALYARFLAESARPAGAPGADAKLEALLARARASGYRQLEIEILRRAAFQQYVAGNMAEYRTRLAQALTAANEAGDAVAQQHLDLDLLNEDMARGDFASAEQRLQRLRSSDLRGDRAFWAAQFGAQLEFLHGRYDAALATLDRLVAAQHAGNSPLPPISRARVACGKAEMMAVQGKVARARTLYAACRQMDHDLTRLLADLGALMLDAIVNDGGAEPAALKAIQARIDALPDGPDRWWPAISLATALTRAKQPAQAEAIYRAVAPGAARAEYLHLSRMVELGLAEVAAARGDWETSRAHAEVARADLPPGDWFLSNRLAELDIGHSLATGQTEAASRQLARLDAQAHKVGDAIVQQEVHSLMPPGAVVGACTGATRAAFAQRTGLRGATLAWMAPRTDRAKGAIQVVTAQGAR
ncbi:winged helix-turn-helix domain-containing protein [Lysobacter olei]